MVYLLKIFMLVFVRFWVILIVINYAVGNYQVYTTTQNTVLGSL